MSVGDGRQPAQSPAVSEESTLTLDPDIAALFQSAEQPLRAASQAAFCMRLAQCVRRLRRRQRLQAAAVLLASVLGGTLLILSYAPAFARFGSAAALAAGAGVLHVGAWLVSPAGWAGSLVLGSAVLWRWGGIRH